MSYLLCWHAHHDCSFPLEHILQSYDERVDTIKTVKALTETPEQIALRLKLFKAVEGELPESCRAEYYEWVDAGLEWRPAEQEWDRLASARMDMIPRIDLDISEQFSVSDALLALAEKRKMELFPRWEAARVAFKNALKPAIPEIMAMHAKECGCEWSKEESNIFSYSGVKVKPFDGD